MTGQKDDDTLSQKDPKYLFELGIVYMLTALFAAALLAVIVYSTFYQ